MKAASRGRLLGHDSQRAVARFERAGHARGIALARPFALGFWTGRAGHCDLM